MPTSREERGDRYGMKPSSILVPSQVHTVYAGFKSLFQGDHLGVERNCEAESVRHLGIAEEAYKANRVLGSDEKTVRGEEVFKIIGAEIYADQQARDAGVVTVSAPASNRIPMICLSLKLAQMPVISRALASRAAGNWIAIFMYRRSLCCLMSEIFRFGSRSATDESEVLLLPRRVAEELVLAGIFGLVALSDVSVPNDRHIYATDASMTKGAFTSLETTQAIAESVWLGGDRRGAYTLLDNPARQLRSLGVDVDDSAVAEDFVSPGHCIDFSFDAVEICGGSGILSKALAEEGLTVCPPIDLSHSPHYDLRDLKLVEWIFDMIASGRFKSVVCEPVCTTFSPAQHPASRSYEEPTGFDRSDPKTLLGNLIAFRCLAIMWYAYRYNIIALLEQPHLSKMAWLSIWRYLLQLGFEEAVVNSCAFGSPHKKPFRLLGWGLPMHRIATRCPGGHSHVRIVGKLTKPSAVYHPSLAKFLARHIAEALRVRGTDEENRAVKLESVVLNDLLSQPLWTVQKEWNWERPAHINVLESRITSVEAMPLLPSGVGDAQRAERRAGVTLQADRVILQQTRDRRQVLLTDFDNWLSENLRVTLHEFVGRHALDCEAVAEALVAYGKDMYYAGKSFGKFSETINAVTAMRPALRRNLGAAWDLSPMSTTELCHCRFCWLRSPSVCFGGGAVKLH
eukprot:s4315_g3.t1